ncbi:MAG: hypothetical protein KatS3mg077_3355 [Candidatus Binatia bacterium]|nr:MAG: hypothetical protein KatS3mg077_3355 [Candidatus Binatia bacterium]
MIWDTHFLRSEAKTQDGRLSQSEALGVYLAGSSGVESLPFSTIRDTHLSFLVLGGSDLAVIWDTHFLRPEAKTQEGRLSQSEALGVYLAGSSGVESLPVFLEYLPALSIGGKPAFQRSLASAKPPNCKKVGVPYCSVLLSAAVWPVGNWVIVASVVWRRTLLAWKGL